MVAPDGAYEDLLLKHQELEQEVERLRKEMENDPLHALRQIEIWPGDCVEILMRVGPDDTTWDVWVQGAGPGSDTDPGKALLKALEIVQQQAL